MYLMLTLHENFIYQILKKIFFPPIKNKFKKGIFRSACNSCWYFHFWLSAVQLNFMYHKTVVTAIGK